MIENKGNLTGNMIVRFIFIHLILRVTLGFILACLAAGLFLGGMTGQIVLIITVSYVGGICVLPFALVMIVIAERLSWRSYLTHLIVALPVTILGYLSLLTRLNIISLIDSGALSFGHVPGAFTSLSLFDAVFVTISGIIAGSVYWALAGRYNGWWLNGGRM